MRGVIERKSGYLEIEAQHRYGEIENSNELVDFVRRGGSSRNRNSIAYFGLNISSLTRKNLALRTTRIINILSIKLTFSIWQIMSSESRYFLAAFHQKQVSTGMAIAILAIRTEAHIRYV